MSEINNETPTSSDVEPPDQADLYQKAIKNMIMQGSMQTDAMIFRQTKKMIDENK